MENLSLGRPVNCNVSAINKELLNNMNNNFEDEMVSIKKLIHFVAFIFLLFTASRCSALTVLAKHDIDYKSGHYTAFPDIYFIGDRKLGFTVTARYKHSHLDKSGERITYSSADCGITWQSSEFFQHPDLFANEKNGVYNTVSALGFRALDVNESAPEGAYITQENGLNYISLGLVEKHSLDNGKNWKSIPLSMPKHAVIAHYNSASYLRTSRGTRIAAFYYQETVISKSKVLFALKLTNTTKWDIVSLPTGNEWPQIGLNETALAELPNGHIIAFMRAEPDNIGYLFYAISKDQGQTWSKPEKSQIYGYPASAILYKGKLLVTVGIRLSTPFSIQAYILDPETVSVEKHFTLDTAIGKNPSDFGYPVTLSCNDNLVTTYYAPGPEESAYSKILVWSY
jgi:hypothetical protein